MAFYKVDKRGRTMPTQYIMVHKIRNIVDHHSFSEPWQRIFKLVFRQSAKRLLEDGVQLKEVDLLKLDSVICNLIEQAMKLHEINETTCDKESIEKLYQEALRKVFSVVPRIQKKQEVDKRDTGIKSLIKIFVEAIDEEIQDMPKRDKILGRVQAKLAVEELLESTCER